MPRIEKTRLRGAQGDELAAIVDWPDAQPWAHAVFAHCFTCTKDVKAAYYTSRTLAAEGVAVLRFDFSGLGESTGDFASSSFSSNVGDLVAAAAYWGERHAGPDLLMGHSLGGTAALAAAAQIPTARAVVTVAAPFEPSHLRRHLGPTARTAGAPLVDVVVAGRRFRLGRQFFDDLEQHDLPGAIAKLGRALLVCHSPDDSVVDIADAHRILAAAREPRSLLALPGAGHLLLERQHARYLARMIAVWARRYVEPDGYGDR